MYTQHAPDKKSNSPADQLERKLARLLAAEKRQLQNENIVRLETGGDISYETVRSYLAPHANDTQQPNFYTETPDSLKNGQLIAPENGDPSSSANPVAAPQLSEAAPLNATDEPHPPTTAASMSGKISIHDDQISGQKLSAQELTTQQSTSSDSESTDPLEELLARALARPKRGRPAAFDEHNKGKLVALLSLGMSLRQAAAVLGVSHGTIRNTLKADPALAEEITAARFQAQLQPLACIIREARRSWKAATWLLKYLDAKIASHEETPDERKDRQQRETEEFFARATGRTKKTRRVLD